MTPELKTKWLDALRSGQFKQARHELKCPRGFCCLGVLLAVEGYEFNTLDEPSNDTIAADNELTTEGMAKFGMTEHHHCRLIAINDDSSTFEAAIDYIETHL